MTTDYRALCAELVAIEDALSRGSVRFSNQGQALDGYSALAAFRDVAERSRELMAESAEEGPTDEELKHMLYYQFTTSTGHGERVDEIGFARAVLARWGNHPESPDSSDGPAVSDDREPASVIPQLNDQLHRRATILLIRKVIDQAIRDTASVQWRVADTGEQLVRVSDLVAWAEHMEQQMEQLND
jgi:hypothetical protein